MADLTLIPYTHRFQGVVSRDPRMSSPRMDLKAAPARRPARDIIDAVVDNMRKNLEPLKYSTLAPSRYTVYLHANEYARLEGIIPVLQEQTMRALSDELQALNRRSSMRRLVGRLRRETDPEIRNAAIDWQIEFLADPDGDMKEGDLLIDSELILPASPELGVGDRTRRITTVHSGQKTTTREQSVPGGKAVSPGAVTARIEWDDDAGHHAYDMVKDSVIDRPRRGWIPGRHPDYRVAGRLARARPFPQGLGDRPLLPPRSELARDHVERAARPQGVRRRRWHETSQWQRNGAARLGPDRSRRHGLPRIQHQQVMTALLWARLVFLALLGAVVGLSAWAAFRTNEDPDQ